MKKIFKQILYIIILIAQIGAIGGVFLVQYLTKKKAGVMHHVYYRKYQFENSIFSPENISMLKIVSLIFIILFLIVLLYILKNKKMMFLKVQAFLTFIMSVAVYIVISSTYFTRKLAYYYFIIAFVVVLLIQILVLVITSLLNKK